VKKANFRQLRGENPIGAIIGWNFSQTTRSTKLSYAPIVPASFSFDTNNVFSCNLTLSLVARKTNQSGTRLSVFPVSTSNFPSGVYHARVRHGGKLYRESFEGQRPCPCQALARDFKDRLERTDPRLGKIALIA
jgi:hypothetical protein